MRGAPTGLALATVSSRIIPADAGSTMTFTGTWGFKEDHPRRCGEHQMCGYRLQWHVGSSPQMRGAHSPDLQYV